MSTIHKNYTYSKYECIIKLSLEKLYTSALTENMSIYRTIRISTSHLLYTSYIS